MLLKGSNKIFLRHVRCQYFNKLQNGHMFYRAQWYSLFQIFETNRSYLKLNTVKCVLKMSTCHITHMHVTGWSEKWFYRRLKSI